MELYLTRLPIDASEMINQHRPLDIFDDSWQSKGIRLSAAGERASHHQAASMIVGLIGQDQGRTSPTLFAPSLRIEVQPDDVACRGDVLRYHSIISFPRSGPVEISS